MAPLCLVLSTIKKDTHPMQVLHVSLSSVFDPSPSDCLHHLYSIYMYLLTYCTIHNVANLSSFWNRNWIYYFLPLLYHDIFLFDVILSKKTFLLNASLQEHRSHCANYICYLVTDECAYCTVMHFVTFSSGRTPFSRLVLHKINNFE